MALIKSLEASKAGLLRLVWELLEVEMSVQNPYEQLGLNEDASFDEIKAARDRLIADSNGDRKQQEMLETAYDAILMERLRMRQEGKIKVPEGVRFPERSIAAPPSTPSTPEQPSSAWLQRLIDTPSTKDVLLPAGLFGGLGALSILLQANSSFLQLALALGIGLSLYFLNRKENLFGRAILLTLFGLLVGLLLGGLFYSLLSGYTPIASIAKDDRFITVVTLIFLWLVCSFLR